LTTSGRFENPREAGREKKHFSLHVDSKARFLLPNWRELLEFRDVLYFLVIRDLKVRYRQTLLGVAWAIIQPFITMIVFTIFFGGVAKIPSDGIPYPIFSFAALVPWTFFSNGISLGSDSLVGQAHLVRKVYFPRLYIPLARILGGVVDFAIALGVLFLLMLYYGFAPTPACLILIPAFSLLALSITLAISLWLSALNVSYRDVRYLTPFLIQIWLFATPIAYPSSLIENELARALYGLNPMTSVVEGFRWGLLGQVSPHPLALVISVIISGLLLITGLLYFNRAEGNFSDVV
jgi:lipopolysaccharide transport system permease protein